MLWHRTLSASSLALLIALSPATSHAQAQALQDYATTPDQEAVSSAFDRAGSTATAGSSLEADYDRLFVGTDAEIARSEQSLLPTTAHNLTGAANALSSAEETAVMGRLRALREGDRLSSGRTVPVARRAPVIKPLQETNDPLNDLRGPSTGTLRSSQSTSHVYPLKSPALYKDGEPEETPPSTSVVQRAYDGTMKAASTMAGAPNAIYRQTPDAPRLKVAPNVFDDVADTVVDATGQAGGQSKAFATATDDLPRRTLRSSFDRKKLGATPGYRGQPLASQTLYQKQPMQPAPATVIEPAPVVVAPTPIAPAPIAAPASNKPVIYGPNDAPPPAAPAPLSSNKPVIYGPNDAPVPLAPAPAPLAPASAAPTLDPLPPIQATTVAPAPAAMMTPPPADAAPVAPPPPMVKAPMFKYQRVDQSQTLTTPQTFPPSPMEKRLLIQQEKTYAMVGEGYVQPRSATDAGAYLWTNEEGTKPAAATASVAAPATAALPTPTAAPVILPSKPAAQEAPLFAQEPAPSYGTQAIPVGSPAPGDQKWGVFISGNTGFGSGEYQKDSASAKTVKNAVTVGADYKLADKSYVGTALTYNHASFTTGNSFGDLRSNSISLALYGTTSYARDAYVDGYVSAGYHALDSERTLFAGNDTTRKAKASPDGFQFNGNVETGYTFKATKETHLGPYAGMRLAYADFDGYSETGAGNLGLKVEDTDNLSAIGTVGAQASHLVSMGETGNLLPALRIGYRHEFGDAQTKIRASFADLGGTSFVTQGAKKSRDWLSIAPSITAALSNDWSFQFQYEHDFFRDDVNENIFNMAAHYKW